VTLVNLTLYGSAKRTTRVNPLYLKLDPELSSMFPGLSAKITRIRGVKISPQNSELENFKKHVFEEASGRWNIDELKDNQVFRAYRDFFWKVKVDPTKTRPAAEALVRRILHGNPLPTINTLVDAYNLASVATSIPFGAFDLDKISGEPVMRAAMAGKVFLGIGMEKVITLTGGEAVIEDDERLIAVYPYRDAEYSKVSTSTSNLLLMTCGVPGVSDDTLSRAEAICTEYIKRFCGGTPA
jgi:DNA/RNA-binding domain of Phe-tRNA-synthetase-like protein